jgi:L-threonylcarbamoyladenylate synthase
VDALGRAEGVLDGSLDRAVDALRSGGVVACPTETFVGLLADALDEESVESVATLKGRAADAPMALLLPSIDSVSLVAEPLDTYARALATRHWPGPLTLVVVARPGLSPRIVRDGTVGVRVPGASPALDLVRAYGRPLTATSANLTGHPPVRAARDLPPAIRRALAAEVGGESPGGLPSTILDVSRYPAAMIREGAIPLAALGLVGPGGRA